MLIVEIIQSLHLGKNTSLQTWLLNHGDLFFEDIQYFLQFAKTYGAKGFRVYAKVFARTAFNEIKAMCRGRGKKLSSFSSYAFIVFVLPEK